MTLPRFRPMLAENRPARVPAAEWSFEPKLDGWRTLVYVDNGVTVRTRTGRDISRETPELAPLAEVVGRRCVFDGELVTGAGLPDDFYGIAPRLALRPAWTRHGRAVTFAVFDILWFEDRPTTALSYRERRALLAELALAGPAWVTLPAFDDLSAVMGSIEMLGLEGLVAKRADSRYRPGERSPDWLKLKTAEWRDVHAPHRHEKV